MNNSKAPIVLSMESIVLSMAPGTYCAIYGTYCATARQSNGKMSVKVL